MRYTKNAKPAGAACVSTRELAAMAAFLKAFEEKYLLKKDSIKKKKIVL